MAVICPKCSHVRPPDASNPDWQCPSCGICYAKFVNGHPQAPRPVARAVEGQGLRLGWLFKVLLLIVLVLILKVLIERRLAARPEEQVTVLVMQEEETKPDMDPGLVLANAAISASGVDATLLHSLSGRLEQSCARNKYGLSESACIARVRERQDGCAAQTAQRFPGQIGNTDRMGMLVQAYVACIFGSA
ncbi:MAG: hypothetical protein AB1437_16820 [Pseudomonadota bacterium]